MQEGMGRKTPFTSTDLRLLIKNVDDEAVERVQSIKKKNQLLWASATTGGRNN